MEVAVGHFELVPGVATHQPVRRAEADDGEFVGEMLGDGEQVLFVGSPAVEDEHRGGGTVGRTVGFGVNVFEREVGHGRRKPASGLNPRVTSTLRDDEWSATKHRD